MPKIRNKNKALRYNKLQQRSVAVVFWEVESMKEAVGDEEDIEVEA
jgi:hypothetical protein